jgi:riboflavin biosynthesis pyrimidine reductase
MREEIAIIWSVDDVMQECRWLTKDQALEVLHNLKANHDATIGINWDVIRDTAALKYPRPPMQKYEVTATIVVTVEAEDHEQAQLEATDHFCWSNAHFEVEEINDVGE